MFKPQDQSNKTGLEIAVIGMAGRFPNAENIDEFWNNLINGIESITFYKDEELEAAGFNADLLKNANVVKTKGGVLQEKEYFDASFFGYTPYEAEIMDPQTRIFLECSWEALENSGYDPFAGNTLIGIYAGSSPNFYWFARSKLSERNDTVGRLNSFLLAEKDQLCTQVSYRLNLRGPSISLQTACSTSLVAIHMACQGILNGECDMAVAGGVTVTIDKLSAYVYHEGMTISPDGHCRAFDKHGKGTVGGEGAAVVVLKSLDDAIEDRDYIYAVIKGSAVNNDGNRRAGFSAPSIFGQTEAIKSALQVADVAPESIGYIEAHGTGTVLGDPVEVEALNLVFNTKKRGFCGIGSVKTNVGHLNNAAGAAGFIKTVLSLKHKLIPPSLHFSTPNPKIDFENSPFYVNAKISKWKDERFPLRAGVSSFGLGGTNAHVILEEAPAKGRSSPGRLYKMLMISANTKKALDKATNNLVEFLKKNPKIDLADTAYSLQVGRSAFKYRKMTVCSQVREAVDLLESAASRKVFTSETTEDARPVVFLFPGLGAEYVNMGLDLYQTEKSFRKDIDLCFSILGSMIDFNIKAVLYPGTSFAASKIPPEEAIKKVEFTQPIAFIFEYALANLLISWGIKPHSMIGYSFGEYAAACISGVFSLEDALKLIVARSKLIARLPAGKMLSVPLAKEKIEPLLALLDREISIAIDNGDSCIVAGARVDIDVFEKQLKEKRCLSVSLETSYAVHSSMMSPVLEEFKEIVSRIKLNRPQIPYISNVTGDWISVQDATNPVYWANHLRETVQFSVGMNKLLKEESAVFIEIGPGSDLRALVMRQPTYDPRQRIVNLIRNPRKKISDIYYLLNKIGQIWLYGVNVNWPEFYSNEKRYRVPLPTYPFEKKYYWLEGDPFRQYAEKLPGKHQMETETDNKERLYIPSWKRSVLPSFLKKMDPGKSGLIFFIDDCNIGNQMVEKSLQDDLEIVIVKAGARFCRVDKNEYTINPREVKDYDTLFNELKKSGYISYIIVHLWSIARRDSRKWREKWFDKTQHMGFFSLLYLVKAYKRQRFSSKLRILIISNDMQAITGEENLIPEKSTIIGPLQVIPQEFPNIICRNIDIVLPRTKSRQETKLIDQLLDEIKTNSNETLVAYRRNQRWVRTFELIRSEEVGTGFTGLLEEQGVYLITGGLGKIGLILAKYLAENYNARLVLGGRSVFPARAEWRAWLSTHTESDIISQRIRKVQEIENSGGEVLAFSADVANEKQMQEVIRHAEARFGRINAVIHAAGSNEVGTVDQVDKTLCMKHFRSKVFGLKVIEKVFKEKELDFCLLLSSISAILGGIGLAAYSAANIFMDTFVQKYRQLKPGRWISVNWEGMNPEQTVKVFGDVFSLPGIEQYVVSGKGDLHYRIDQWVRLQPLREEDSVTYEEIEPLYSRPDLVNPYTAPRTHLERILVKRWQNFFGIEPIGVQDSFFELGGDSLKAISILAGIHKEFNVEVLLTDFFKNPTVEMLAKFIDNVEMSAFSSIMPIEKKEYYVLTSGQRRLFFLNQIEKNNTSYNQFEIVLLEGELDREKMEDTFKKMVDRHEVLRTAIEMIEDVPFQRIYKNVEFKVEFYDSETGLRGEAGAEMIGDQDSLDSGNYGDELPGSVSGVEIISRNFVRPFDLSNIPLLRVGLIRLNEKKYILMIDMPHIITDAISHKIFLDELKKIYAGEDIQELRIQYKDYSEWKNSKKEQNVVQHQEKFWLKEFGKKVPLMDLPTDYPRPLVQTFAGKAEPFEIDIEETKLLKSLALEAGVTLFILLLSVYYVFLSRLSNRGDIVVGTPIAGRRHKDTEYVMGFFTNTLALRNFPNAEKRFRDFLEEVNERTLQAFDNQEYLLEDLVSKIGGRRDLNRNPLFDIMFGFKRIDVNKEKTSGLNVIKYEYEKKSSKFDMSLDGLEVMDKLHFTLTYRTALFKHETIKQFVSFYKNIVSSIIKEPDLKIAEIEVIPKEEKARIASMIKEDIKNINVEFNI